MLLRIENLTVKSMDGILLINGVSLIVGQGETVCLVGQSGGGKSTLALAIMGLLPRSISVGGQIYFEERLIAGPRDRASLKGRMAVIFQDPDTALNPAFTIGTQLTDVILAQKDNSLNSRPVAWQAATELLSDTGMMDAGQVMRFYPHQISGGMKQRVLVAMALSMRPRLLIADEPTTALDNYLQAQILRLIKAYQAKSNCGLLLISHDLALVKNYADQLIIIKDGSIVETGDTDTIFNQPKQAYTKKLLDSVITLSNAKDIRERLHAMQASK